MDGDLGNGNTAEGGSALSSLTTGTHNTADGFFALGSNDAGADNTATGFEALALNTGGGQNTADGTSALFNNTTGINNTATGWSALHANTTGNNNIALGFGAGSNLDTGSFNIDIGNVGNAGEANIIRIGDGVTQTDTYLTGNIHLDRTASRTISVLPEPDDSTNAKSLTVRAGDTSSSGVPFNAQLGGNLNLQAGNGFNADQGATGGNVIISSGANWISGNANGGYVAIQTGDVNNTFIERMRVTAGGQVGIDTNSPANTLDVNGGIKCIGAVDTSSDDRYKTNVAPLSGALDKVLRLRGVSYDWKRAQFPDKNFTDRRQIGLIAQQVREILPEIVSEDAKGYLSIGYTAVIPVLVEGIKELDAEQQTKMKEKDAEIAAMKKQLAEQATVFAKLQATIAQQQKDSQTTAARQEDQIKALTASLKDQAAQIQKVNDRVELKQPAPQVVDNHQ